MYIKILKFNILHEGTAFHLLISPREWTAARISTPIEAAFLISEALTIVAAALDTRTEVLWRAPAWFDYWFRFRVNNTIRVCTSRYTDES